MIFPFSLSSSSRRFTVRSSEVISCSREDGYINGSVSEWRANQWKVVQWTDHFQIWENQDFNEVKP